MAISSSKLFLLSTLAFAVLIGLAREVVIRHTINSLVVSPADKQNISTISRPIVNQEELIGIYQSATTAIISSLAEKLQEQDAEDVSAAVSEAKSKLLALIVPTAYKDIHLNLVIALSSIDEDLSQDKAQLTNGLEKLRQAIESASWLSSYVPKG